MTTERIAYETGIVVIYDTPATEEGTLTRYEDRQEAIDAAREEHTHLHLHATRWVECNDAACTENEEETR